MTVVPKAGLHAFVARGPKKGVVLFPHMHEDGKYVVSPTRFKRDYLRIDEADIVRALDPGLKLRMSNPEAGITASSLISPSSIQRV